MVEIAISLAVIAFALVAIIGVLPSGLTVQRENREETIINQDASVFINAIRNGARGLDDLTNYVYAITNWWTTWDRVPDGADFLTNNPVSGFDGYGPVDSQIQSFSPPPKMPITNGLRIIGLMSRPKYELFPVNSPAPTQIRSNHIVAFVRAMSGIAAEKTPQTNADVRADAFAYRLICDNQQVQRFDAGTPYGKELVRNLRELRLRFLWPVSAKGLPGTGRQTFRMEIGGFQEITNDVYVTQHPLFFFRPTTFVKVQP